MALDSLQQVHVLLILDVPKLDTGGGLMRAEQRGTITFFALLTTLLLMLEWIQWAFWAASTHCRLMLNFSSTNTPQSLLLKAVLNLISTQHVCLLGIVLTLV